MENRTFGLAIAGFGVIVAPFYFALFALLPNSVPLAVSLNIKLVAIVFQMVASVIAISFNLILLTAPKVAKKQRKSIQWGVLLGFFGFALGFVFLASWFTFIFSLVPR